MSGGSKAEAYQYSRKGFLHSSLDQQLPKQKTFAGKIDATKLDIRTLNLLVASRLTVGNNVRLGLKVTELVGSECITSTPPSDSYLLLLLSDLLKGFHAQKKPCY